MTKPEDNTNIARIYMPLLDEGVPAIRPIDAEILENSVYRVLPLETEDTSTETWQFPPGSRVKCRKETWSNGEILVAYLLVDS